MSVIWPRVIIINCNNVVAVCNYNSFFLHSSQKWLAIDHEMFFFLDPFNQRDGLVEPDSEMAIMAD